MKSSKINDNIKERYKPFVNKGGGIFVKDTKKRLLGLSPGRPGWSEDTADYRYNVRSQVKQALIDLALFIEVADEKDVSRIINQKSLEPIARALLWNVPKKPNASLAKIAHMLIWYGFHYLKTQNPIRLPNALDSQIDAAIDISNYLTDCFMSSSREEAAGNSPLIARTIFLNRGRE